MTQNRQLDKALEVVKERSGGLCEVKLLLWSRWDVPRPRVNCDTHGDQAHHLLRRSQGGPDTPGNLLWVCTPCHDWIHANPELAVRFGLLRRSGTQPGDATPRE